MRHVGCGQPPMETHEFRRGVAVRQSGQGACTHFHRQRPRGALVLERRLCSTLQCSATNGIITPSSCVMRRQSSSNRSRLACIASSDHDTRASASHDTPHDRSSHCRWLGQRIGRLSLCGRALARQTSRRPAADICLAVAPVPMLRCGKIMDDWAVFNKPAFSASCGMRWMPTSARRRALPEPVAQSMQPHHAHATPDSSSHDMVTASRSRCTASTDVARHMSRPVSGGRLHAFQTTSQTTRHVPWRISLARAAALLCV